MTNACEQLDLAISPVKKFEKLWLICKSKQRGFRVEKYKDGLYKLNNFLDSPNFSYDTNFTSQLP